MARLPSVTRGVALAVALVLAGASAFLIWRYVDGLEDEVRQEQELVEVYTATGTIPQGTLAEAAIANGLIVVDEWPRSSRPDGAITSLSQLTGLAAADRILPGEAILQQRFADSASAAVEFEIPEGLQAISLEVGVPDGVAGFVRPGDAISVIAHVEVPEAAAPVIGPDGNLVQSDASEDGPTQTRSQFVVQDVPVLGVGRRVVVVDDSGQESGQVQQTEQILVTLAVSDQQAEKLVFALKEGQVYLTLLSDGYEPQVTPGRTFDDLFVPTP